MRQDIESVGRKLPLRGGDREPAMRPCSEPADHQRLKLAAECGCGGTCVVRVRGLLVAPDLQGREAARPANFFERLDPGVAVLLAARIGEFPNDPGALLRRSRRDTEI